MADLIKELKWNKIHDLKIKMYNYRHQKNNITIRQYFMSLHVKVFSKSRGK